MTQTDEYISRDAIPRIGLARAWPAFLILAVSLLATFFAWRLARTQVDLKRQAIFHNSNVVIVNKITQALDRHAEVLRSLQSLYGKNVQVVRDVFELFAEVPKDMHPGILSIAYAPRIERKNADAFVSYARNEGYEKYSILPAGTRNLYFPIEHIVSREGGESPGFDLASDPVRRAAIDSACSSGSIVSSTMISIKNGTDSGIAIFAPIYTKGKPTDAPEHRRSNVQGVCSITLDLHPFINDMGKSFDRSTASAFVLYDGPDSGSASVLYEQTPPAETPFRSHRHIGAAGRRWTIVFSARPSFDKSVATSLPTIVLGSGTAISLLLFWAFLALISSRSRAMHIAEQITRSQRRIVEASQDIIGVLDAAGMWKSINPACNSILGRAPKEVIGTAYEALMHPADREQVRRILASAQDEKPLTFDARMLDARRRIRCVNWNATPSKRDGRVYLVGRDVTERKKAEREIEMKNRLLDLSGILADHENVKKERLLRAQSHEIRTQLTSIMGFIDLVLSNGHGWDGDDKEFLETAYSSSETLHRATEDWVNLSLAKTSDLSFRTEPSRIGDLLDTLERRLHALWSGSAPAIEFVRNARSDAIVTADKQKLAEAVASVILLIPEETDAEKISVVCSENDLHEHLRISIHADFTQGFSDTSDGSPAKARRGREQGGEDTDLVNLAAIACIEAFGGSLNRTVHVGEVDIEILFPIEG